MIATWLTLAALNGRWQVCPYTSAYRNRAICASWTPAQEFKVDAASGRVTLLTVKHYADRARYCHIAQTSEITEAGPRGSRFRMLFRQSEDVVVETGAKFDFCSAAHASEAVGEPEWVFETYGDQISVKFPDGMRAHLLRRFPQ